MAYIGRDTDKLSNIEVLDVITFDGSSSYTLQKNSVNFVPSSANNLLVSIDGVVQANNFTVSGSTIDFGVAVPSTSTCDWIYHIGVGLITTPADGTVTTAKLADSSVSLAKLSATGTKDATTFLRGDNTFSTISAGITEADQWRLTTDTSITTSDATISSNLERVDSTGFNYIGTGMTQSSGIFTFPTTGIYYVRFQGMFNNIGSDTNYAYLYMEVTTNNSSYSNIAYAASGNEPNGQATNPGDYFVDVTDTSNVKVRFRTVASGGDFRVMGNTGYNRTSFTFIRLGDT